jgi:flagellar biosynthesis protein
MAESISKNIGRVSSQSDDRRSAVAIGYDADERAPRVLAKGYGDAADAIVRRARELGIPLREDQESIIPLLMKLDLFEFVPPELYAVIVEVLVWAHRYDEALGHRDTRVTAVD